MWPPKAVTSRKTTPWPIWTSLLPLMGVGLKSRGTLFQMFWIICLKIIYRERESAHMCDVWMSVGTCACICDICMDIGNCVPQLVCGSQRTVFGIFLLLLWAWVSRVELARLCPGSIFSYRTILLASRGSFNNHLKFLFICLCLYACHICSGACRG